MQIPQLSKDVSNYIFSFFRFQELAKLKQVNKTWESEITKYQAPQVEEINKRLKEKLAEYNNLYNNIDEYDDLKIIEELSGFLGFFNKELSDCLSQKTDINLCLNEPNSRNFLQLLTLMSIEKHDLLDEKDISLIFSTIKKLLSIYKADPNMIMDKTITRISFKDARMTSSSYPSGVEETKTIHSNLLNFVLEYFQIDSCDFIVNIVDLLLEAETQVTREQIETLSLYVVKIIAEEEKERFSGKYEFKNTIEHFQSTANGLIDKLHKSIKPENESKPQFSLKN